jgi:subtilisin family serine protease
LRGRKRQEEKERRNRMDWNKTLAAFMIMSFVLILTVPVTPATSPLESPVVVNDGAAELTTIVTLITGDTLEVTRLEDGRYLISIASNGQAFKTIDTGEDTYVIPVSVEQFVGDTLDMELFNIDYLVENGYSDTEMNTIPVIIEYSTNPGREHAKINAAPGLLKKQDFETVYASSAELTKEEANAFANATFYTEGGLEGVKKIWLDRKIQLSLDESVPGIGAPYAWDLGYDGSGIKIAIIDTGIWKDHPDLAGKVIAEKDFTDDGTPMDLYGHGTHCAGIAAANGTVKGVAPGASLINAKALNKQGSGYMSWAMAAWEWAAEQGANIFSMSFGTSPTDGTAPWDIELNTIVETYNIVAVVAAGNAYDYYNIASPAAADKAIAVGASTKPGIPMLSVVSPEVKEIQANLMEYSPKPPVEGIEKPIVYAGLGSAEEFAQVDVAGKIALIKRGVYTFKDKVINAANAGAVAAIIFNNAPGNFFGSLSTPAAIPAVSISQENGQYLVDLLKTGVAIVNLRWDAQAVAMADFSSRGPRLDNAVKPEIVAPGVAIKSTVPTYECALWDPSGYKTLSGTSMSTPHIAGAAALLLQKHPDWKPMQIRDALMSTAKVDVSDPYIYPKTIADIYTQGSGLVAVDSAIDAKVVFEPAEINFGKIKEPWPVQTKSLAIRNYGDKEVALELRVEKVHDTEGRLFDLATLDKYTITVPAGGIETVTLSVDLSVAPTNIPLGGRIIAKDTETEKEIHAIFGIFKERGITLKIKLINPEGLPWGKATVYVYDVIYASPKGFYKTFTTDANGEVTATVPPSFYNIVGAYSWTTGRIWPEWPLYWLEAIEIPLYEDKTVILDARETKPVTLNMTVEPTDPSQSWAFLSYDRVDGTRHSVSWMLNGWRCKNYMLPATSSIGKVNTYFRFEEIRHTPEYEAMASKSLHPTQKSPVVYDLFYTMLGEVTVPMVYTADETTLQQMAMIKAKHFSTDINPRVHQYGTYAFPTEFTVGVASVSERPYLVPIERDEYLTPNKARYMQSVRPATYYFDGRMDPQRSLYWPFIMFRDTPLGPAVELWKVYKTGERLQRTWLEQPIKPWTVRATRTGNSIKISQSYDAYEAMDASGNMADRGTVAYGMTFKTEVYKDDMLFWEVSGSYYWVQTVPPEEANYKIELYSNNVPAGPFTFAKPPYEPYWTNYSTETFTTIKFKSKYVEGTENLPIINLNYKIPGLSINNVKVVSKKDPLVIQIIPQHLRGLDISNMNARFWYSYDDGATWKEVKKVVKGTDRWIVKPEYEGENYISIKTLVTDVEGNSIEQRIMRAFFVTTKPQNFWFDQP